MMNVITSEFYKILRSKATLVISILLFIMNLYICTFSIFYINDIDDSVNGITMYQDSFNQDAIFYIILAFVCYLITTEYSSGSIKQIASHGIKRYKIVFGKYIAMNFAVTFILILFAVINLTTVTITSNLGSVDLSSFIVMNIGTLCMILGVSGVGTILSYLFKNSGVSIGISFICVMSKNFICALLAKLSDNDIFIEYSISNMRSIITDFTSSTNDVLICSIIFLLIGVISVVMSSLLFTIRDID